MSARNVSIFVVAAALIMGAPAIGQTIAVTEFLNNANGDDDGAEWIEFYNDGATEIDLTGWRIYDEDLDDYPLDGLTIAPGDFLILVGGSDAINGDVKKFRFELEWLAGGADARVHGIDQAWALGLRPASRPRSTPRPPFFGAAASRVYVGIFVSSGSDAVARV